MTAGGNPASLSDGGLLLDMNIGINNRIYSYRDVGVDIGRFRIKDGDTGVHPLINHSSVQDPGSAGERATYSGRCDHTHQYRDTRVLSQSAEIRFLRASGIQAEEDQGSTGPDVFFDDRAGVGQPESGSSVNSFNTGGGLRSSGQGC